jgi:glycosyltransferase involved in cell wall biosynthesis
VPAVPGPTLALVVPAYNERDGLDRLVDHVEVTRHRLVDVRLTRLDLVLVDDGSSDGTGAAADDLAASRPWMHVVTHAPTRGMGAAIRNGFAAATTDLVLYTDADLPVDLIAIDRALDLLPPDGAPFVVSAVRTDRWGDGAVRIVYTVGWNTIVRIGLGLRARDVNFAFKLLPRGLALDLGLRSDGPFIDAELLGRAQRRGVPILQFEVPFQHRTTGTSTMSSPRAVATICQELVRHGPAVWRAR